MADLTVKKGDKGYIEYFTLTDSTGAAKDLTGYSSVTFKAWPPGHPDKVRASATCNVTSTTGGLCQYTVLSTDFPKAELLHAELQLATGTTVVESSETFTIEVQESP